MRMVSANRLEPGMTLAVTIFSAEGRALLRQGVTLSDTYIRRLRQMNFTYVYIDDDATNGIEPADSIPIEVRQVVLARIRNIYDHLVGPGGNISHIAASSSLGKSFTDLFRELASHVQASGSMIVSLSALYSSDSYLYTHCMNVGITATMLGLASGYPPTQVEQLGLGAMLHDIGKIEIDPLVINKPGALTTAERKLLETHCQTGYDLLCKQPTLSPQAALCALQHHERMDGTGYPQGLREQEIDEFSRLVSVCDVFDALVSNRSYRKAFLPHEALEYLFANAGAQFDKRMIDLFARHVNIYPVGLPVRLSNGAQGVIEKCNDSSLQRPQVRVLQERDQKVKPYSLNLADQLNVVIAEVLLG